VNNIESWKSLSLFFDKGFLANGTFALKQK
jgi:hypothetical protein